MVSGGSEEGRRAAEHDATAAEVSVTVVQAVR
jgi:hypothetical protein